MSFEAFSPMWSHVNENEKKNRKNNQKSKMENFEKKTKKLVWRHGERLPFTKCGINLHDGF